MRYVAKPSQISGSCSCHLGMLHYLCKHVIKAVNVSSSKSVPENMMALGMWAGSTLGGFKQLEDDLAVGRVEQLEATSCWQLQLAQEQSYLMTQLQQVTAQTQLGSAQLQLPGSPAAPLMMLCATVSTPAPSMHQSRSSICVASCAKNRVVLKPSGPATAQASTSRSTDSEARQAEEHYSQDGKFHTGWPAT
jgi:hypothetical protein